MTIPWDLFIESKTKNQSYSWPSLTHLKPMWKKLTRKKKTYFSKTYVRFSMAQLDEIQFSGSRNRYEKYDFYIAPSPVFYKNDGYMKYLGKYYKNLVPRLPNQTNTAFYNAVIKSSPTLLMRALGTEYALKNMRIREIVMIQSLSEVFYSDDFLKQTS